MGAVDDALAKFAAMADDIGLENDEKDEFINSSMARKGFKQVSSWAEPDDGKNSGGDFFSRRNSGNKRDGGGFTQYRTG